MKKIICIFMLLIFFIPAYASKSFLHIQHWTLSNKTRVFFVRRTQLPMVDIELIFSAGSSRDHSAYGLSALTNETLSEGAGGLSAKQLSDQFENAGAQFDTFSNRDMAGLLLRSTVTPDALKNVITHFKMIVTQPNFSTASLDLIKSQMIAQLKSNLNSPSDIAENTFFNTIYDGNFYAHNPLGSIETIQAISQQQVIQFYKEYYVGANANLILVGDLTDTQAKQMAEEIAGQLPEGKTASPLPTAKNAQMARKNVLFHSKQSTLIIGQVGVTRESPDYYSLMVGNAILGGLPLSSILYHEIREKRGLVYSISSEFDPLQYRGPFIIYLQTESSHVGETDDLIKRILRKFIDEGPTVTQLNAAKKSLVAGFPMSLSSNSAILKIVANIAFYHRPLDFLDHYQSHIQSVTAKDVKTAFQKNIDMQNLVTVIVGPA